MEDPDYILDINGLPVENDQLQIPHETKDNKDKKCLYVMFDCCGVYQHIYKNKAGTHYEGRCPKCLRLVKVAIGPGGTDQRFFHAK